MLTTFPFKLTQNNIVANVAELCDMMLADIVDPVALQLRNAIDLGHSRNEVVELLTLLRDTSCSTQLVEKGHGRGAALLRKHTGYGTPTLQSRMAIHQCRGMLPGKFGRDPFEMHLEKCRKRMTARFGARELFFRKLVEDLPR